jgi:CRP/FNR family cyclic AMP-dependent transcriptional regulator
MEIDVVEPIDRSLLAYLAANDQRYLLGQGVRRSFRAEELMLHEGDPGDHILIVRSGWVRVSTALPDGQEVLLALRGPGDVIGELAMLHGWTRTATVRSLERVEAVLLRGPQFMASIRERPEIALALVKTVSARLREAESTRIDIATLDVSRRVATYLLRLADQHGRRDPAGTVLDPPLTQQDIANRVGASRRAVARSLAVLRERGIVLTARRRIVVAKAEVLRSLAHCVPNGIQRQ